jgi:hypothetical protein
MRVVLNGLSAFQPARLVHLWRGIEASGYDLLPPDFRRILRLSGCRNYPPLLTVISVPTRLIRAEIIAPPHPSIACCVGVKSLRGCCPAPCIVRETGDAGVVPDMRPMRRRCQVFPTREADTKSNHAGKITIAKGSRSNEKLPNTPYIPPSNPSKATAPTSAPRGSTCDQSRRFLLRYPTQKPNMPGGDHAIGSSNAGGSSISKRSILATVNARNPPENTKKNPSP